MKKLLSLALTLCMLLSLALVAGATEEAGKVFAATPEELNALPEALLGTEGEFAGKTVVFSQRNIAGSEWYEQLIRLAKEEAKFLGVELVVYDAGDDIVQQLADIETAINLQPDAIIVNPQNSSGVLPSIAKVHEAGIPLTVVNSALDAEGAPFTFVSCDVENSGYQAGFELAKAYDAKHGWQDEVQALVLSAAAQEKESDLRRWGQICGYTDYMLEKYGKSNLKIVAYRYYSWQPEPAMNMTLDALQANPDIDIIFSACDGGAQGVVAALDSIGRSGDILICSIDARSSVLKWIMDGDKGVVATVSNDPRMMGKWAVYLAAKAADGYTTPATFYVPNQCYTAANVEGVYDPDSTY